MSNLLLQLQLLLAALSALLPLLPADLRARTGAILDLVGKALSPGGSVAANADVLTQRLTAVRAEVEAMAAAGHSVSADELDAAMARVTTASEAFRQALQTAEAAST